MPWYGWLLVGLVAAVAIDRAMLAAERRGWVYWRHRKPSSTALGTALLSLQSLLEPDKAHVVEERRREQDHREIAGDDEPVRRRGPD